MNKFLILKDNLEKKKRGSNRMEPRNSLIPNYNISYSSKYLNISSGYFSNHAGMAEWLLQSADPGWPFRLGGSIPSAGVINFLKEFLQ